MKKMILVFMLLLTSIVLVGCNKEKVEEPKKEDPVEEKESFQLIGHYDELANQGIDFYFLLNLNADGTAVLSSYNAGSMAGYDARDYKENEAFITKHDNGTWSRGKDAEGEDAIIIKTTQGTFYGYETNGIINVSNFKFLFYGAYSREATLEGSKTIQYKDYNAFIQAYKQTAPAETPAS